MESLRVEIAASFGQGNPPHPTDLVRWDGFDQFEKESAVSFYSEKTWFDVFEHLRGRKGSTVGAAYYLEEWSVLSPEALPYYLRAFLEFLLETLSGPEPDEEFVFSFLGQLYQVIYMYKGSPFTQAQTLLLQQIAQFIADDAADNRRFPYFQEDIQAQTAKFLAEVKAYDG